MQNQRYFNEDFNKYKSVYARIKLHVIYYLILILLSLARLRHERDLIVNLKHEEERLGKEIEQEENDMKQLVDVMAIIEK